MAKQEEWRPVVGYEGWYEVSDRGRIRRSREGSRTSVGFVLKPSPNERGYLHVGLSKEGQQRTCKVHLLVSDAFIGPRGEGKEVNHKDGDKTNNHSCNLEHCTKSENTLHAYSLGLMSPLRGEENVRSKLTEDNVKSIRLSLGKETHKEIAARFGVSRVTVTQISNGKSWGWLSQTS